MTDEEKQAIERLKNNANYCITSIKTTKIILNLIEKQQAEIEVYKDIKELADTEIKEILNWKYENKKLKSEIEEKDNEIKCLKCLHNTQVEIIEEMAKHIKTTAIYECPSKDCEDDGSITCEECIKEYFKKKVNSSEQQ